MHDDHTPKIRALVNPNQPGDKSGCGHLAAAGVVFVLVVALNRLARQRGVAPPGGLPDPMAWLDLAALGTLCDMAPLKGINRAFVTRGLKVLERMDNAGLAALAQVANIEAPRSRLSRDLCAGTAAECGRADRRSVDRGEAAGDRRPRRGDPAGRAAAHSQHRAKGRRGRHPDGGDEAGRGAAGVEAGCGRDRRGRRGLASGRHRHRGGAAEGKVSPPRSGDRLGRGAGSGRARIGALGRRA